MDDKEMIAAAMAQLDEAWAKVRECAADPAKLRQIQDDKFELDRSMEAVFFIKTAVHKARQMKEALPGRQTDQASQPE